MFSLENCRFHQFQREKYRKIAIKTAVHVWLNIVCTVASAEVTISLSKHEEIKSRPYNVYKM